MFSHIYIHVLSCTCFRVNMFFDVHFLGWTFLEEHAWNVFSSCNGFVSHVTHDSRVVSSGATDCMRHVLTYICSCSHIYMFMFSHIYVHVHTYICSCSHIYMCMFSSCNGLHASCRTWPTSRVLCKRLSKDKDTSLITGNPPPREGFFVEWFPDQEPCVRDFTTRCDGRISSWNLLHTALDQGTT